MARPGLAPGRRDAAATQPATAGGIQKPTRRIRLGSRSGIATNIARPPPFSLTTCLGEDSTPTDRIYNNVSSTLRLQARRARHTFDVIQLFSNRFFVDTI